MHKCHQSGTVDFSAYWGTCSFTLKMKQMKHITYFIFRQREYDLVSCVSKRLIRSSLNKVIVHEVGTNLRALSAEWSRIIFHKSEILNARKVCFD